MHCPPQQPRPRADKAGSHPGCSPRSGGLGGHRKRHCTPHRSLHPGDGGTVLAEGRRAVSPGTRPGGFLGEETPPLGPAVGAGLGFVPIGMGDSKAQGKEGQQDTSKMGVTGEGPAAGPPAVSQQAHPQCRSPPVPCPQHGAQRWELLTVWGTAGLTAREGGMVQRGSKETPVDPADGRGSWLAIQASGIG